MKLAEHSLMWAGKLARTGQMYSLKRWHWARIQSRLVRIALSRHRACLVEPGALVASVAVDRWRQCYSFIAGNRTVGTLCATLRLLRDCDQKTEISPRIQYFFARPSHWHSSCECSRRSLKTAAMG